MSANRRSRGVVLAAAPVWILAILMILLSAEKSIASAPSVTTDSLAALPHPRLVDAQTLSHARERTGRLPWVRSFSEAVVTSASRILEKPVDIPTTVGQWTHHYVCQV